LPFVGNAFLPKEIIDPIALLVVTAGVLLVAGLAVKPPLKVEATDVVAPLAVTVAKVSASVNVLAIVIVLSAALDTVISLPSTKVIVPAAALVLVSFNVITFPVLVIVYVLLSPVASSLQAGSPLALVFQTKLVSVAAGAAT
jgi:hypothetical protein